MGRARGRGFRPLIGVGPLSRLTVLEALCGAELIDGTKLAQTRHTFHGNVIVMDDARFEEDRRTTPPAEPIGAVPGLGDAPGWIALPVGRAETGPSIAELVRAVKAAGGYVGGEALFDPRYEPEMRRFLIRALEMEGIPLPRGGGTP